MAAVATEAAAMEAVGMAAATVEVVREVAQAEARGAEEKAGGKGAPQAERVETGVTVVAMAVAHRAGPRVAQRVAAVRLVAELLGAGMVVR